ncbi:MAG: CPXCG motif-containing cysteine-rich protein [Gammaproteobacteria bacterium]|nr:CPXCG motif-containing cysteine-rich protein [Gammaproteobacteria bacterium]
MEGDWDLLQCRFVRCPYCGERIELVVDCSVSDQRYVEDCQVCCRPMVLEVTVDEVGHVNVHANDENAC